MEEGNLAEPPGRRSLSGLMCVCGSGLWVGSLVGPGPTAAVVWLQVKQGNQASAASVPGQGSPHQDVALHSTR